MNARKIAGIRCPITRLRSGRRVKKLSFKLFLELHGSAESCIFCQTKGTVKVITRPIVTGKISRETIEAINAIEIVRVDRTHLFEPPRELV
jgi:hypothetical protein